MILVDIGFGNIINMDRLISVVLPDSAPIKRSVILAKDEGLLIDASCGKSTRSVIFMDSGHIILSSLEIKDIINKVNK